MRSLLANVAALSLALLVGVTASAQTNDQAGQSKDQPGGQSKNRRDDSQRKQDSSQDQGQTERIRGELAGVSVVGETMVDYDTGRGVLAEFTYLTILGSPPGVGRQGAQDGRANSDSADSKRGEQDKDKAARSGDKDKDQGSNQDRADRERGDQDRSGDRSATRRNVYQIAVSSETQVRNRSSQSGRGQ